MTQYLRDVSTFSKEEVDTFVSSFDTVLADCDGVLWHMNNPLAGSIDVINRLKTLGKKVFLVSNNCTSTVEEYIAKVKGFGLNITEDEIIIPSIVASSYLKEQNFNKKAFMLASPAFKKEFEKVGIHCSNDVGPDFALNSITEFVEEVRKLDKDVGAVVIDYDMNINYIKMMKALLHLKRPDCRFVVGASDVVVPVDKDVNVIGPGSFISTIELVSGRKAVVTGKPSPLVKEYISKKHHINTERTLMIGDMIALDMQFGTNCGFQKLLVLSGIATLEDTKTDKTNLPHYYINTLGDLLPLLPSA